MSIIKSNETGFFVEYEFEYKGHEDSFFSFEVPSDIFIEGVKDYFNTYDVNIDGRDNHIWNVLLSLDCLDKIFEEQEDWFKEKCETLAYEEFKQETEEYYYDELDDYIDSDEEDI